MGARERPRGDLERIREETPWDDSRIYEEHGLGGPEQTYREEKGNSAGDLEPKERSREIGRRPAEG